jgi:Xaa-Pro aminopeptidase
MVIEPVIQGQSIVANTTFLVPEFEKDRALALDIPVEGQMQTLSWEEHVSPYAILREYMGSRTRVMLDEEMRLFIADGLRGAGFEPVPLSDNVASVKQVKSRAEISLLTAVNSLTVEGVRAVQKCAYYGVTEAEMSEVLDRVLESVGMSRFFDLVLFGENAACPHCSSGSKKLEPGEFILIDVGAHLHGLSSDICRTFLLPIDPARDMDPLPLDLRRKFDIWQIVLDAQTASLDAFKEGVPACEVDLAARRVIERMGYGHAFTHRLGHGIGIKAHESPYLNKGETRTLLRKGMTFTSEPGIYLEGDVGVRHEDIILVTDGEPVVLTDPRAASPWQP